MRRAIDANVSVVDVEVCSLFSIYILREAQSHSTQLQNFKTQDHPKNISRQAREKIDRREDSTEATASSAQD